VKIYSDKKITLSLHVLTITEVQSHANETSFTQKLGSVHAKTAPSLVMGILNKALSRHCGPHIVWKSFQFRSSFAFFGYHYCAIIELLLLLLFLIKL